jgi:Protein of unknown function (DUF1499)
MLSSSSSIIIIISLVAFVVVIHQAAAAAYQPSQQPQPPQQQTNARRAFFVQTASSSVRVAAVAAAALLVTTTAVSPAHAALDACPPGSSNCIRTTWTAPAGSTKSSISKTLTALLESYPQAGQADVDKGGWTMVSNDLSGATGTAVLEFKSGIGNFAKFFNGGKPFIDDVKLEIVDVSGGAVVDVRSSSRVGESDLGVNQKRLQYLQKALQAQGWTAPDPKY